MPFGKKPDGARRRSTSTPSTTTLIAPAIARRRAGAAARRRGAGRRHHPQADVRAADPVRVRRRRPDDGERQRLLRARRPPRVRPCSTVLVFADGGRLPFDVAPLRALPYALDGRGCPADAEARIGEALAAALRAARSRGRPTARCSSCVEGLPDAADRPREDGRLPRPGAATRPRPRSSSRGAPGQGVDGRAGGRGRPRAARGRRGRRRWSTCCSRIAPSRRWEEMIALVEQMPAPLAATVMVQEQLGFALNRAGRSERGGAACCCGVLERHGPSSETYGLLGRVYKDRWEAAREEGEPVLRARAAWSRRSTRTASGFEADWRDAYPGRQRGHADGDPRAAATRAAARLLPVVRYAGRAAARAAAGLLGPRHAARARPCSRDDEEAALERSTLRWRRARAVGARDHGRQPRADPRGARRARPQVAWADEAEQALLRRAGRSVRIAARGRSSRGRPRDSTSCPSSRGGRASLPRARCR